MPPEDLTEEDLLALDAPPAKRAPAMSMTQAQALYEQLKSREDADQEARRQMIEQELASRAANKPLSGQIDFTPAAQYLDDTFGGNSAKTAAAESAKAGAYDTRSNQLFDELTKLKKGQGADALLSKLIGQKEQDASRDQRFAAGQDFKKGQAAKTDYKDVFKIYDKDRTALNEVEKGFQNVEDAFSSGDAERINGALVRYARTINQEKGPLSDSDVARTMIPNLDIWVATMQKRLGNRAGKVDPKTLEGLAASIKDARRAASETAAAHFADRRQTFMNSPLAGGFEAAQPLVVGTEKAVGNLGKTKYVPRVVSKVAASAPAQGGFSADDAAEMAALKAELEGK